MMSIPNFDSLTPAQRLIAAVDFLDSANIPADDFDMELWALPDEAVSRSSCGFAGCAIGWLCHLEAIPGLVLSDSWPVYADSSSRIEHFSFSAVAKAFGVNEDLAVYLFDPDSYARPTGLNEVIERMRLAAGWPTRGIV